MSENLSRADEEALLAEADYYEQQNNEHHELTKDARAGERVQRFWCSDCQCEHTASVLGGPVNDLRQSDGLTELQRAMIDHDDDCARLDRTRLVVPPERGTQLQSLAEVESERVEREDYERD